MPAINESELKAQIKNKAFSRVYLLCGEEQLYVKSYTKKLVSAVTDNAPTDFNFYRFSGEINLMELDASTQLVSFFGSRNCVLAEDIYFDTWRSDEPKNYFLDIISRVPESTVLIISMPSYVPKTNAAYYKKLISKVTKLGSVCEFPRLDNNTLEKHIGKWARENGRIIPRVAASRLISECGTDLNRLKNEVDKVCAYSKGEEVTPADIDAAASLNFETTVFKLSDAVIAGRPGEAYEILDYFRANKEEPIALLAIIAGNYIDAYRARVADESGVKRSVAAADFQYGKRTFALDRMAKTTRRLSTSGMRRSLALLADTDARFKSAGIDKWLVLEQLIAQLLLIAGEERV